MESNHKKQIDGANVSKICIENKLRALGKENFDLREYQRVYKSIFTELTDKNRSSTIQNEAQTRNAEICILCDKCTYTSFNNEDLRKHKNDAHSKDIYFIQMFKV